MLKEEEAECVIIDYTNWRGERSTRRIWPARMFFGSNEWHKKPQWLVDAYCFESNARRTFALSGVHSWTSAHQ